MRNRKIFILLVIGALVITVSVGMLAYQSVNAATPVNISSTTTQVERGWVAGRGSRTGYSQEDLANALGITVDELNEASQSAYEAALADAVSQDLLTQTQAEAMVAKNNAFPFGNHWMGWLTQNGIDFNTYLAEALEISEEELVSAYQTAFFAHIDQAVTDGKLSQEQADLLKGQYALSTDSSFKSSMQSAFTEAVNKAVTSGVITQAQGDQILSNSVDMYMRGLGGFGPHGGRHDRGMGMEFGIPPDMP